MRKILRHCESLALCFVSLSLLLLLSVSLGAQGSYRGEAQAAYSDLLLSPEPNTGIKVAQRNVLFGNPGSCKAPAEVDLEEALRHTPEGQQIEDEGIRKGTARYSLLARRGLARVRQAIRRVAVTMGKDCVVKAGSILRKPDAMDVSDITDSVIDELS
ncbi:MAG: hypothetical protein CSA62_08760 [Planctomycetota bacterium]|nr:MAG: hypothetical protein CSA62_08760 [Planctomycetota bacterium]